MKQASGLLVTALLLSLSATAATKYKHESTSQEFNEAINYNKIYFSNRASLPKPENISLERPVEEYADYKYLLIQAEDNYYGLDKTVFAKNLPANMKLVVLTEKGGESDVRSRFGQYLPPERLIIATHETAQLGFWARDSFPYPVVDVGGGYSLVSHRYYRAFNGQSSIAQSVQAKMDSYNFVFVGGNLMADEDGNCFVNNSQRLYGTSVDIIKTAHGCKTITALPWVSGIGDVDEVIKLLPHKNALTNSAQLQTILESKGYTVTMLPDAGGYRTYANSLILGNTVFMPSYGTAQDDQAESIYERFGYKVVKIDSRDISDNGHGSVHCITMAYPEVGMQQLLQSIGYKQRQ